MCKMYVKSCETCLKHAVPFTDRYPLLPIEIVGYPFENLVIDVYGPELPKIKRGNRFILTCVDVSSRFLHAMPLKDQKSVTIANELLRFFSFVGLPKSVKSDCQSSLNSQLMTTLNKHLKIETKFSTPYCKLSVGLAERFNRTIGNALKCFIKDCPRD
jgi:Integrase core domain